MGHPWLLYYFVLWVVPLATSFFFFMLLRQIVQHGNTGSARLTNTRVFLVSRLIRRLPAGHERSPSAPPVPYGAALPAQRTARVSAPNGGVSQGSHSRRRLLLARPTAARDDRSRLDGPVERLTLPRRARTSRMAIPA